MLRGQPFRIRHIFIIWTNFEKNPGISHKLETSKMVDKQVVHSKFIKYI